MHHKSKSFRDLFDKLPVNIQELAIKNYELLKDNPAHPSLRFKSVSSHKDTYSARVGGHYRAMAVKREGHYIWFWIGTHETYNKLI